MIICCRRRLALTAVGKIQSDLAKKSTSPVQPNCCTRWPRRAQPHGYEVLLPSSHNSSNSRGTTNLAGDVAITIGTTNVPLEMRTLPPNGGAARPYIPKYNPRYRSWTLVNNTDFLSPGPASGGVDTKILNQRAPGGVLRRQATAARHRPAGRTSRDRNSASRK